MQYGFVIDHRKCIGCHACTVACKSENDVPVGAFRTWVKYTELGAFPAVRRHFTVLRCNHCTSAPCVTICPVTALHKRADGIVDLDRDACIGCKACMQACPYDALYLNRDTGAAEKCHYCAHRVTQGLKPACEVVCPEEAIVSGDLHDPESAIAKLAALPAAAVRRPEQRTGPNVHYLGIDPVSLHPGRAAEPSTYLWSERRLPPPDYPADVALHPNAMTVLDVSHDVHWGWKVSAYLVTKGFAAGAAMFAPFAGPLGLTGWRAELLPELLALAFLIATLVLLITDLQRPHLFLRLLTRPNPRSWLVKGGWVLGAFGLLTTLIVLLRLGGHHALAAPLRWLGVPLGAAVAGYTAFLFAQCEGRDLWQRVPQLLAHLLVQAVLCGAALLLPFAAGVPTAVVVLTALLAAATAAHFCYSLAEVHSEHETDNARQASSLLQRIPLRRGSPLMAFRTGLSLTNAAAALAVLLATFGWLGAPLAALVAGLVAAGLFCYELAYVRAGQLPPLS